MPVGRRRSGLQILDDFEGVIIGSDEAGYGSWAGPLIVCAVAAPVGWDDHRIRDSKRFSRNDVRASLCREFTRDARFTHCVIRVEPEEIDREGVYQALLRAHREALQRVHAVVGSGALGVVDGNLAVEGTGFPTLSLPKADALVPECSLASIIAKTEQCQSMVELDAQYPGYGLASSKGYGTAAHKAAVMRLGPSQIHRMSYAPMRTMSARGPSQQVSARIDE